MTVLVKFRKDWADEFYVYGFKVYDSIADWEADLTTLPDLEYYFGTNEGWYGDEFSESDFQVHHITRGEGLNIIDNLGVTWGNFPF